MLPRLLRKLKFKPNIRNKIAIIFIFSCCFTSVFYLLTKIQTTTDEYKRSSNKNENNHDLYLISKFLYIYNESLHSYESESFNTLNLIFMSRMKEQTKKFSCVSTNKKGEVLKSKLNFSFLDLLTKESFLHKGKCKILTNYVSFFIEINNETIEIEKMTEIIYVPLKLEKKSVCVLPLFLYSNMELLKNLIEFYRGNSYNFLDTYTISLIKDKNNITLDKYNFIKDRPWFIFNNKESLNVMRDFHTISFTKYNLIESMKTAIFDCYFRYKETSKEIVFLNLNSYSSTGTNYSYINELFVPPQVLLSSNKNKRKNKNQQVLKNINLNLIQNNETDIKDDYVKIIQTGECFCTEECNDICNKFNQENIIRFNVKNSQVIKKKMENKVISMNDFNIYDTEYFDEILINKCSFFFQEPLTQGSDFKDSNKVTQAFNNVLQYFKARKRVSEEKRCYLSLLFDNISCIVSNLSFHSLVNRTNIYLPFNDNFVTFDDGCHF